MPKVDSGNADYQPPRKKQSISFLSNQSVKGKSKIFPSTQFDLTVNGCDWHISAGNDGRIVLHYLTRPNLRD